MLVIIEPLTEFHPVLIDSKAKMELDNSIAASYLIEARDAIASGYK